MLSLGNGLVLGTKYSKPKYKRTAHLWQKEDYTGGSAKTIQLNTESLRTGMPVQIFIMHHSYSINAVSHFTTVVQKYTISSSKS